MKKKAFIVDMDGTLSLRVPGSDGTIRGHYPGPQGEGRVLEDEINYPIRDLCDILVSTGLSMIVVSGRTRACEADTNAWLRDAFWGPRGHWPTSWELFMREIGDTRKDWIIKGEIYREKIAPEWDVKYVLDDRNSVVRMWRDLGLTCLQVAEGDF